MIVEEYAPAQLDEFLTDLLSGRRLSAGTGAEGFPNPSVERACHSFATPPSAEWACTNCLREYDEPYCAECGRNLMEVTR